MTYRIDGMELNPVELKCLVVSRGVKVDNGVYQAFAKTCRLDMNPMACNCFILSDGTIVQLTDTKFHLKLLSGILSWDNLKLLRYAADLGTPFALEERNGDAVLCHNGAPVDVVTFPPPTDFYRRKTAAGLPYIGNAVLQGMDWVAFQCLWHCEYAAAGKPCEYCFSGAEFEARAKKGKQQPRAAAPADVAEIVAYAIRTVGCNSIQITGGSTFAGETEARHIAAYLQAIAEKVGMENISGERLLYITPPEKRAAIDSYFALGASRIACSIEVWDEARARVITPGKIEFTTRARHLEMLEYTAQTYGPGKAFSNFIIGLEPFETLAEGAEYLARRGVIPTASIWMPMGRPVMGSMSAPDVEYYRRVIDLFATLYDKYHLEPAGCCGLNVCMERDIWKLAHSASALQHFDK